jgi:hypothetical protein
MVPVDGPVHLVRLSRDRHGHDRGEHGEEPMVRILLTETLLGASDDAMRALRAAGFRVTSCRRDGAICRALLTDDRCPLDDPEPIGVTVVVRPAG